jgi:omega-amidase
LAPLLEASDAAVASAAARAAELGLALCGSAYGPGEEGEAPRNRLTLWSQGAELLRYDKVHLFALTAEHLAFSAGERPPPTATLPRRGGGELLVSGFVCYDLRFGPLVDAARAGGAELLLVPAQWPVPRATQWRALLAGRAVETQAVVLGCNRCGRESLGRRGLGLEFPGNSLICGPDGAELAAAAGSGEQLVVAEVDWSQVGELRRAVRIADDRRPDLYRRW